MSPRLSVIITTRAFTPEVVRIAQRFAPQMEDVGGEVLIVGGRAPEDGVSLGGVRHFATDDPDFMRLRAWGLGEARGDVIAIGEDHAYPAEGWARAVLRAHDDHPDVPMVLGCLVNATDRTTAARASFLSFAAPFTPPMPDVPGRPPPISVVSIKRAALDDEARRPGDFENELLPRLHREGRLVADDRIVAEHWQAFDPWEAVRNGFDITRASYGYARSSGGTRPLGAAARVALGVARAIWYEARTRRQVSGVLDERPRVDRAHRRVEWRRRRDRGTVGTRHLGGPGVMSDGTVPLSVIVPARHSSRSLAGVLDALVPQVKAIGGEVIVAGGRGDAGTMRTDVRFVATDTTDVLQLRALALSECRGDVVAVGEDHAYPLPGWAEAIVRAHVEHPDVAVVVGCLVNGTDTTSAARANFLVFAAPFVAPMSEKPDRPPPVSVVSIKRAALEGVEHRPGDLETELLPRLHRDGQMIADERIVADHRQPFGIGKALQNAFDVSRASYGYAHARWSRDDRRKTAKVALHIAPALWREGREGQRRAHSPRRDLPSIALLAGASSVGACLGALFGPGGSARRCS